jgi:4-amino-4-deoxy-L-arabinose transferase-like glycosyltransferase
MGLIAMIAVLLVVAAFRLVALDSVPPGLHHDEVIIAQVAKDILRGRLAIYFPEGYGHEPLYHYLLAGMFAVGGANEFTLRLTTALLGILMVAVVYRMACVMFGLRVAVACAAWMAVSLWPVFYSRVGLRNITLPLMISLAAWLFWEAHRSSQVARFVPAGLAFGLAFYTYQGSRVFPFIFAVWTVYLALFHRKTFVRNWRGIVVFFAVTALVAAPLAYYLLVVNPQAEARIANLSGPLEALRAGDPSQVIQLAWATAGMFTVHGDGVWLYNVGGRPVFPEPISGVLFYIGILIALWRWRQPAYALLLIWLLVSLAPAAVSWPAPDFVRALGALPVTFVFPAVAVVAAWDGMRRHTLRLATGALVLGVLGWNTVMTARDYFVTWPANAQVRWLYQATWTQATRWLDAAADTTPVAVSGLKIHDLDPQTFDILLRRHELKVKWFDCRTSILLPGGGALRYISPDFFPCDVTLWAEFLGKATVIAEPRWPDTHAVIFTAHQLERQDALPASILASWPSLSLAGSRLTRATIAPGDQAELLTFWSVTGRVPVPTAFFVHIVSDDGKPLAQWDGFDFGEAQLEPGDQLIERHRFPVPSSVAPGDYRVIVGVYDPATNKRFTLPTGQDYLILGRVTVR